MLELFIAGMAALFAGQDLDIDLWYQNKTALIMGSLKDEKAAMIVDQKARFTVFDGEYVKADSDEGALAMYYLYTFIKDGSQAVDVHFEVLNCTTKEKVTYRHKDIESKNPKFTDFANPNVASVGEQDKLYRQLCLDQTEPPAL